MRLSKQPDYTTSNHPIRWAILVCTLIFTSTTAFADALERRQAKRLHDRLAGIPPEESVLDDMEAALMAGNGLDAALIAMDNKAFYNITLKNFATPWSNRERTLFAPLNDYTATVIGMIRDKTPFNELLSANLVYVGDPALGLPDYSMTDNNHYQALEDQGIDLKTHLQAVTQTSVTDLPVNATAGVMTTRAAAEAFFVAGTNRAMFRFTLLNHLCNDMEQVKDSSYSPDRIRQDVSRSPGGDSRLYLNSCIGCHNGMDPMAQAFAYYNFDETTQRIQYTPGSVQPKYHINDDTFKYGFITPDDRWDNYWRSGQNALLGWDSNLTGSGSGAKSMGRELANSEAFARCQVKKAFKTVCLRDPGNAADRNQVDITTASFKADNYNMKTAFAEVAVYCMGE
ncbi:MAG: hypothetical protein WBN81_03980 [Gammaproteobacteria bacterium]